tara:strand:+ start:139 stop:1248 length:1110 start_codon:yes stop_codon:yes gene_type:complete
MKKVLLIVVFLVFLTPFYANASTLKLTCDIFYWEDLANGKTYSEMKFPIVYIFDVKKKEIKQLRINSNEVMWRQKNYSYQNKKIILEEFESNGALVSLSFDFNKNIIHHSDTFFNVKANCNKMQELAILIEKNSTTPSISKKEQNIVVAASSGTGFFVSSNGHMVTNNHVIEACDNVKAHYKGKKFDIDVLFVDRSNDLAIIKANIKPKKIFSVSNEDISLLEDIIVAGYPLGKNISSSIKTFKGSVTSLAGFGDNYSNFQIDASLSSGNSGGPIIDQKGNVVGVAVEKLVEVGIEGFNFGVKSSTLKTFASSNQFKFQDPSTEELSNKELGQLITEATIYLECWMSVAKIKQIIQEGERQKAFFSEYK